MNISRILRHGFAHPWQVRRALPRQSMEAIEATIRASEKQHGGEIRVAVEAALDIIPVVKGQTARGRALELFSGLKVWDTEHNNGVLIYLLLADRDVEIVVDRGLTRLVPSETWESICRAMEIEFGKGRFETGLIKGITLITGEIAPHFPHLADDTNELPDTVSVL